MSETVAPSDAKETLGANDATDKAVAAMQGGEQIKEMESMAAKGMRRGEMEERGLSPEQIAAYLG